jgi:arginine deiminase
VEVLYVAELLAETVKHDAARRWLLDRVVTEADLGHDLAIPVREFLEGAHPAALARHLIGGVTLGDLPESAGGLVAEVGARAVSSARARSQLRDVRR